MNVAIIKKKHCPFSTDENMQILDDYDIGYSVDSYGYIVFNTEEDERVGTWFLSKRVREQIWGKDKTEYPPESYGR